MMWIIRQHGHDRSFTCSDGSVMDRTVIEQVTNTKERE